MIGIEPLNTGLKGSAAFVKIIMTKVVLIKIPGSKIFLRVGPELVPTGKKAEFELCGR
jgi:hypothetical protein